MLSLLFKFVHRCAPECITFLKFTSASDVWAFGVTLWEMFSYGFQPWAAQTGQQILEAIDEPNCLRLEQPLHCPAEHYSIMQQCWRHGKNGLIQLIQVSWVWLVIVCLQLDLRVFKNSENVLMSQLNIDSTNVLKFANEINDQYSNGVRLELQGRPNFWGCFANLL